MKLSEILSPSFKSMQKAEPRHPSEMLWRRCLSICSEFCEAVVKSGYLSWEQMLHAACRYNLGASKQHGVIFWQIDQEGRVHDGKIMYYRPDCHRDKTRHPTWVSSLLRHRDPFLNARHESSHCLFGLHLLSHTESNKGHTDFHRLHRFVSPPAMVKGHTDCTDLHRSLALAADGKNLCPSVESVCHKKTPVTSVGSVWDCKSVCVVEAEKTVFILSEIYPQYIWLAAGGLGELQVDKFRPLRGRKVILFPDTDPDGKAFRRWYDIAQEVMASPFWEGSPPIRVSPILELHATPAQKSAKIDLIEFLLN